MKNKNKKILEKAERIITKHRHDDSIYYQELVKSYQEYKQLEYIDKTTNELYIEHINRLCEFVVERKYSNVIIIVMLFIFLIIISFTSYTAIKYYDMSKNLKENIIKANSTTNLNVVYSDIENFNALTLADMNDYIDLKPLVINLSSNSTNLKKYKIRYNIYIVEDNKDVNKDILLNKDVFLYNVVTNKKDTGIKALKDAIVNNDKLLIYTGTLDSGSIEDVNVRMWIDKNANIDYKNKLYKFKFYVTGYVL